VNNVHPATRNSWLFSPPAWFKALIPLEYSASRRYTPPPPSPPPSLSLPSPTSRLSVCVNPLTHSCHILTSKTSPIEPINRRAAAEPPRASNNAFQGRGQRLGGDPVENPWAQ
jgi:hypothetical protein